MRVLLVEDDPMIASAVLIALRDAAYAVDHVADGEAALVAVATHDYDFMLLDLGLPGRDGLGVLAELRRRGDTLPVLVITARDALADRVAGLDMGADDYIAKPFETAELVARMRAVMRRQAGSAASVLTNGHLSLDLVRRVAAIDGQEIRLTAKEFALLQALMLRPGAILSRHELEERVYGWNEQVESNAVEYLIHGLRRKLGSAAIRNVRGLGWSVASAR
ncbi:response regulator [Bordetella genomosp. 11]|uniref:DNA-binding response regulator n=1 Tax=Bordetella genomosp. 11 TaxID=1416808 RepID=A0A261ULV8_9BORD|nr:response regulator [Bordetella genomosp. 11]OZI62868.1 DNA-binding response regulator [Bordetella genomosp. 11]